MLRRAAEIRTHLRSTAIQARADRPPSCASMIAHVRWILETRSPMTSAATVPVSAQLLACLAMSLGELALQESRRATKTGETLNV